LENLGDNMTINCAWESGKEIVTISATVSLGLYVLKQHTPWIDEDSFKAKKRQTAMVTGSEPNEWIFEQFKTCR
jgi:hypothetical protein